MIVEKSTRKALEIKYSGRSTDYLTPTIIFGCGFQCLYCYCKRHKVDGLNIATNLGDILTEVNNHAYFTIVDKPNQTHPEFISYDLGCNSDMALHTKHYDWKRVFDFFKNHPKAMGSFATKYVNKELCTYNPEKKIRIRFSLMPQSYSDLLEPNTSKINERLEAVKAFQDAGYDVHLNFSPVIVSFNWLQEYEQLFKDVREYARTYDWDNDSVKCEVIFLTHNLNKHQHNLEVNPIAEELLWKPDIQEGKISQYGGENIRYNHKLKYEYIKQFTKLHDDIIPWNTIRYIF